MAIVKELFSAYKNNELPTNGGYILSSFFEGTSAYARYELISYNNVKAIYPSDEGLTFQADGKKMYILVEPANYPDRYMEPAYRDDRHKIPYRFKEVEVHSTRRQEKIMIGKKPVITFTSFTILNTEASNFSYVLYNSDDLKETLRKLFETTLWKDAGVPRNDSIKSTDIIMKVFDDMSAINVE